MSFTQLVEFFASDFDSQLQAGYIACCLLALFICLRPWRMMPREQKKDPGQERHALLTGSPGHSTLREKAVAAGQKGRAWMEGPGPGAVLHMLVFVGTATAALVGWRIPAEIERIYGDGAGFGLIFPNVTMPTIGRLAQVIGALTFAVVALRFLRVLVPFFAVGTAMALAILAVQYVTGVRFFL